MKLHRCARNYSDDAWIPLWDQGGRKRGRIKRLKTGKWLARSGRDWYHGACEFKTIRGLEARLERREDYS